MSLKFAVHARVMTTNICIGVNAGAKDFYLKNGNHQFT